MPLFSERNGYVTSRAIQLEGMDSELKTSLWNFICVFYFDSHEYRMEYDGELQHIANILYDRFHKRPIRNVPESIEEFIRIEEEWFTAAHWYRIYDYCEFILTDAPSTDVDCVSALNQILEREKSGYRIIDGVISPIIDPEQIASIQTALENIDRYHAAATHIKAALELYANRRSPDYRNAVKESISAVESVTRIIANDEKATLGDAIKAIGKAHAIHPAFKDALLKLYGFTSDAGGVRHSLMDKATIDEVDARFMLVMCSAFVNYLIARA